MVIRLLTVLGIGLAAATLWLVQPQVDSTGSNPAPERGAVPDKQTAPVELAEPDAAVLRAEPVRPFSETYEAELLAALAQHRIQSQLREASSRGFTLPRRFLDAIGLVDKLVAAGISQEDGERIAREFADALSSCMTDRLDWRPDNRMNDPCILNAAQEAGITTGLLRTLPPVTPRAKPDVTDGRQFYADFGGDKLPMQYPALAAEVGQEGWVLIEFSADTDGCVTEVGVADSSPEGYFEDTVMAAFVDLCFSQPKTVAGNPVAAVDYPVLFSFLLDP